MKFSIKRGFNAALVVAAASAVVGCGSETVEVSKTVEVLDENCLWVGPYTKDVVETNFAYPDAGALYWSTAYTLPEGATLKLKGEFPYARYMSLNAYRTDLSPAHAIADNAIAPKAGSINPFVQGNDRLSTSRNYEVILASGITPEIVPANTLYSNVDVAEKTTVFYRVYVPNSDKNGQGGVPLPKAELTLATGEVLTGDEACSALAADTELLQPPLIPVAKYQQLRANNPASNFLQISEAGVQTSELRAVYNKTNLNLCSFGISCDPAPKRQVAWYANFDNQYMISFIDRAIKPIAVIHGKAPATPATLSSNAVFNESQAQLRYWSICQNEYYSQKVKSCLYDEQVTINPDGSYIIVTSLTDDRPENAISENGVEFLEWAAEGDGFSIAVDAEGNHFESNETDGFLVIRNMLPVNKFSGAIQNTSVPGDEATVLGDYMPVVQYFTKAEFEALGDAPYKSL